MLFYFGILGGEIMEKKSKLTGKGIRAEMLRVKDLPDKEVVLDKEAYLSMLHELKVLRFKVCRQKYWGQENGGKANVQLAQQRT